MSDTRVSGVISTLVRLCDTGLAALQNRVELFSVELQEEKCRVIELLLLTGALVALGMMTLTLVTVTTIYLFAENARLVALIVLTLLYGAGTALVWRKLQARLRSREAFSGTVGELQKDRACLNSWHSSTPESGNS